MRVKILKAAAVGDVLVTEHSASVEQQLLDFGKDLRSVADKFLAIDKFLFVGGLVAALEANLPPLQVAGSYFKPDGHSLLHPFPLLYAAPESRLSTWTRMGLPA